MRELGNSDSEVAEDHKKPGIYIWGFLYENKPKPTKKKYKLCDDHCNKKNNWKIVDGKKDNVIDKVYETIELGDNEQCSKLLFIPYYVGISTIDGVEDRLNEHKKMDSGHSAKYVRLKEEFMLCYHKHLFFLNSKREHSPALPIFPILKGTLNNNHVWTLLAKQGYVYHFNRQSTCMLIDHQKKSSIQFNQLKEDGNYSITDYSKAFGNNNWIIQNDPLKSRVKKDGNYNFWFTYCELDYNSFLNYIKVYKLPEIEKEKEEIVDKKSKIEEFNNDIKRLEGYSKFSFEKPPKDLIEKRKWKSEIKSFFEQAEAATYFALRGITFSRTHTVDFPNGWNIENNSGFNIFLENQSDNDLEKINVRSCDPSDQFNWPGYW
jgi:hypothetical protein